MMTQAHKTALLALCFVGSLSHSMTALAQNLPDAAVPAPVTAPEGRNPTLYQDLGGLPVITQFVDATLVLALADIRIKDTFKDTNMKRLARLITEQFCELTGGPCKYSGDPMKEVHQGLGLSNMQFNALVEDLQLAMDQSHIPFRVQNRLLALLAPMQRDVVTK